LWKYRSAFSAGVLAGVYRDGDFGRVGLGVVWGVQGGRACGQVVPEREDEFTVELPAVGVLAGVQGALQVVKGALARLQRTAQIRQQALAQGVCAGVLDALAKRLLPREADAGTRVLPTVGVAQAGERVRAECAAGLRVANQHRLPRALAQLSRPRHNAVHAPRAVHRLQFVCREAAQPFDVRLPVARLAHLRNQRAPVVVGHRQGVQ
jgi:hypothetical protein